VGTITRTIDGDAGARLVAARSTVSFDQVTIVSEADFAIAQLRYSENTPEATKIVSPDQPATVSVTQNGQPVGGVAVEANTFATEVELTVRLIDLGAGTGRALASAAQCHAYLLGQVGRCIEITAVKTSDGSKAPLLKDVVAGVCPPTKSALELFKFDGREGRPLALRQTSAPFLRCEGYTVGSTAPKNWLEGLAQYVGGLVTPKPLYAAHSGFGGVVSFTDGLSIFTWASPLQVSNAGLATNVLNSGKDAIAVNGTFGSPGFDPATEAVTVGLGKNEYMIPAGSFKFSAPLRRYVFASRTPTGVTAMVINPNGGFTIAATVPTEGPLSTDPLKPTTRPLSLTIGSRAQGALLVCSVRGLCVGQEQ
jgi:hypothetical protein